MSDPQTQFAEAVAFHQAGDLSAAEPAYRRVLENVPHHLDALYLLGTLQLQRGEFAAAVEMLSQVCAAQPKIAAAHNNLGIAYKALGQFEKAIVCLNRAIKRDAKYAEAYFNLGQIYEEQQQWPRAEGFFVEHLELAADDVESRVRLGFVLTQQDKFDEAAQVYEQVVHFQPAYAEIHGNLSFVYERLGRIENAVTAAERAVALRPDYAEGYNNLGNALRSLHQLDGACAAFDRALEIQPNFPLAKFNWATTRMLAGDLAAGWGGFEAREAIMPAAQKTFLQPRWRGESLAGKTLLVHADEGFGDTLQFARFLAPAEAASGARIILHCPSGLGDLLRGTAGVAEVVVEGDFVPVTDTHIPLLSLPGVLGITGDTLPATVPYLAVGESRQRFDDIIDLAKLNVGLVWQGNPVQPRDCVRSCPLSNFSPLMAIDGIRFISLQVGAAGLQQLADVDWRERVINAGSGLTDFSQTAALIDRLDLVVSVDTAVAHLSGALGADVWTLLSHTPDWRWQLRRGDSPWYPTMRLFRQPAWGDWSSVIQDVAADLSKVVVERFGSS
jgi:tetratricopeptide (TPR) repeat protein